MQNMVQYECLLFTVYSLNSHTPKLGHYQCITWRYVYATELLSLLEQVLRWIAFFQQ